MYIAKQKRWYQKRYKNRLRRGLCPICGGERTGEWIVCETCREKSRAYSKAQTLEAKRKIMRRYRDKCRKDGFCYGCGRYIGLGRYKRCEICRERDRRAHAERYVQVCIMG